MSLIEKRIDTIAELDRILSTNEIWDIIINCRLSIDVLEYYINNYNDVNWIDISIYQELSEEFIEKYKDSIDWMCISKNQKLSEEFIDEFKDEVDWYDISYKQTLSEQFIEKHKDKVEWYLILEKADISYEFLEKHLYCFSLYQPFINNEHLDKLRKKYPHKYQIDKLEYELNK